MEKIKTILKAIWAFLKKALAADKVAHFCACFAVVVAVAALLRRHDCAIFVGILAAMAAGIIKEIIDKARGGVFDTWDLLADFLGTFTGAICAISLLLV